ncbi:MAG: DUF3048 domain-containing protein [Lachnospiraceae bacterium]|nr:DUF3048 domain-containing protein [Lachnospiraceae bacterium]
MKNRMIYAAGLLGLSLMLLTACGKKKEDTAEDFFEEEMEEAEEEGGLDVEEIEEEEEEELFYSLLTHEPVEEELTKKRPISIMIENTTMALPQYGINKAGIVYECPAEGGITRFLALFDDYSGMDRIGNVRSCRPYYAYIAAEFDSIYLHYGQSVQGQEVLNSGIVDDLNGLDGAIEPIVYFRSSDKPAPHNAYTSTDGINDGIEAKGYRTEINEDHEKGHFRFAEEENTLEDQEGEDAEVLSLYFPNDRPYYVYDEEEQLYTRYQFGDTETDANDGENVKAANLILQNVPSSVISGSYYLDINLNGSGTGKFLTRGKVVDISWSKNSNYDITHYFYENGDEIELNPGKTWVHLVENAGGADCKTYATREEFESN